MRTIEGFVCVGKIDKIEMLFGQPTDPDLKAQKHESLLSNGLNPYLTLAEAREAGAEIAQRSDVESIWIGRIEMTMAESYEENESPLFKEARSLVIVVSTESGGNNIFGPAVADRPRTCNETCTEFVQNGLRPFTNHQFIRWPLREVMRLSQLPTRLATFSLERVAD